MGESAPTRIGSYEVIREIGRGGMGVVSLARDTRLDRDVAIKALPDDLAENADRLMRFEREAKLLASLNHPNVASVYGLEELDGRRYLILEFIKGETLDERLSRGAIPIDDVLRIAIQIARAVEAAHEKGIIHRDLKPANIMCTSVHDDDQTIKVLDFGLAKAFDDGSDDTVDSSESLTVVRMHSPTIPGVILGTAGYLSPEQARGRPVDKRTDIFSFGCVLYEMLAGRAPFPGETAADAIGAMLHENADLARLPAEVPPAARRVLERCLQRDRSRRLRDIGDARIELESALDEPWDAAAAPGRSLRRGPIVALVAVMGVLLVMIGVLAGRRMGAEPAASVVHLAIPPPPGRQIRHAGDLAGPAAVSPDGSTVAFAAAAPDEPQRLWLRRLHEPDAREIPGTEGAMFPFWSPDGRSVGFFTREELRRVDLDSGNVATVCEAREGRGGAWTHDGRIIFAPAFTGPLHVVADSGGEDEPLTTMDRTQHTTHRWPTVLPDGERFLYYAGNSDPLHREAQGIYLATLDGAAPRRLARCEVGGQYADGWLLFVRESVLLASRVDLDEARLTGEVRVVTRDVAADRSTWHGQFSVTAGTLAFNRHVSTTTDERRRTGVPAGGYEADVLTSVDRTGRPGTHYADGLPMEYFAISPDGYSLALSVQSRDGTTDIWHYPTAFNPLPRDPKDRDRVSSVVMTPNPRRLTFLEGSEGRAVWAPDSKRFAFARHHCPDGTAGIYVKHLDGGSEELLLAATDEVVYPDDWTRDGKHLIYIKGTWLPSEADTIWAMPLDGGDHVPLVETHTRDWMARVSPDGRWLAYASRRTVRREVYVIPFAPAWPADARERQWQISLTGGRQPVWSDDGTELFYISDTGTLMAVPVTATEQTFAFGASAALFPTAYDAGREYGVFPPGAIAKFVFMEMRHASDTPVSVVLNWQQLLEMNAAP